MDALWVALTVYPDSALTVGITDIVCDKNVVARAGTELVIVTLILSAAELNTMQPMAPE